MGRPSRFSTQFQHRLTSTLSEPKRAFVLVLAAIALALAVRVWLGPNIRDDAYITLRYAENLANGQGFTFNPGEQVLGTTTPLMTLIVAGLIKLGLPSQLGAVWLGIASDLATIAMLYLLGRSIGASKAGVVAGYLYSVFTPVVSHAVSGMETPLYLLLITTTFTMAFRGQLRLAAASAGLAVLLRPDALILVGALTGAIALQTWRHRQGRSLRDSIREMLGLYWKPVAVFVVVVAPWVGAAWLYFGSPIPQSLIAKWDLPLPDDPLISLKLLANYFSDTNERLFLAFTILAAIGLWFDIRKKWQTWLVVAWALAYAVLFTVTKKFVWPVWPFEWYYLPLLIPYTFTAAQGLVAIARWLGSTIPNKRHVASFSLAALVALVLLAHIPATVGMKEGLARVLGGREELYFKMSAHILERAGDGEVIAAREIGALGASYPGPILDMHGLVTPWTVGSTQVEIITTGQPHWIVNYDTLMPIELIENEWFETHYRPVYMLQNWETRNMIAYRWYPEPTASREFGPVLGETFELLDIRTQWSDRADSSTFHLILTWRALKKPSDRYTVYTHIYDTTNPNNLLTQQDNEPQEGSRPTTTWRESELIVDRYDLTLPSSAVSEDLFLIVGVYKTADPQVELDWRTPAGSSIGRRLSIPLAGTRGFAPAATVYPCDVTLGNSIRLTGYSVAQSDRWLDFRLYWHVIESVGTDYAVFAHLLDATGNIIAQHDGPPTRGRFHTSTLQTGSAFIDSRRISIPINDLAHSLRVGLYDSANDRRLPRSDGRGDSVVISIDPEPKCQ